jgi:tRNA nucleotidyltransferase (CCA-adding enzyme)
MHTRDVTLPQPVVFVLLKMMKATIETFVVGGAVRDVLLERETSDWDFTTKAKPEEIQALFKGCFYDNVYGTVGLPMEAVLDQMEREGWSIDREQYTRSGFIEEVMEITTYRSEEGYSDRRRPDKISWGETLKEDLLRRDFTINALALEVETEELNGIEAEAKKSYEIMVRAKIIDLFEGMADLERKVIRTVGDPKERFSEDALRMMRAIRFGAQLAFSIDPETVKAIQENAHLLKAISRERIRDELIKILASAYPADGMTLLYSSGLLEYILPELLESRGIKQGGHHIYDVWKHSIEALRECPSSDPIVRLATLLHDVGKPKTVRYEGERGVTFYGHEVVGARMARDIGRRLRLSNKEVDRLFILVRWHMFVYDTHMTDAAIRRFIKRVGLENINDMIMLRVGDRKGGGSKATSWRLRELQQRIGEQLYEPLGIKDLVVNGKDVMEIAKIEPGPKVGEILNQLFDEVMEDSSKNTKDYLKDRIVELGNTLK